MPYFAWWEADKYLYPRVDFCPTVVSLHFGLSRCASAFDGWVEVGGFGCRPLWGGVTRVHPWSLMRGSLHGSPNEKSIGSTQFLNWPGMGLDLCRASHINRPCATLYLVGGHCASAFDSWVEVGDFVCRPLWGEGTRVHPRSLMRGAFMAPRMRVHRKHAIFELARHGSRSVPGFPRKTALCHTLPGGRQTNTYTPHLEGYFCPTVVSLHFGLVAALRPATAEWR